MPPESQSKCRSCGAPIVWGKTSAGKAAPFERDPAGTWILVAGIWRAVAPGADVAPSDRFASHFARCPHAAIWREGTR